MVATLGATREITPYLIWTGALIVVVVGAGLAIMLMRRRLLSRDTGSAAQSGLLDSLRAMRDQGRMSAEEYDAARKRIAAKFAGGAAPSPQPPLRAGARDERRSRPGFDLTGAPLPKPDDRPPAPE